MSSDGIHVVHVGTDPASPGGMSAVIRTLISSSLAERHRLEVIATYRPADPSYRNVDPVARLTTFAGALVSLLRWCLRRGRRLVHVHAAVRGSFYRKAICVVVAKAARRPVILHVHGGAGDIAAFHERIGPVRRRLLGFAFRAADRLICVSTESAEAIRSRFGVRDVLVVPNPAPPIAAPRARRAAPAPGSVNVLYVGGFANPVKGGDVLLDALPELCSECPGARFTLAGPGDPPARLGVALERAGNVVWAGWLDPDGIGTAIAEADVFLLPSLSEGLPLALLEALSLGKAVVATRVGGIPEVVRDGIDGVLVPPGDPAALRAAVRALIADPARRATLAEAARERAASFSPEAVCERLDALYRELAG